MQPVQRVARLDVATGVPAHVDDFAERSVLCSAIIRPEVIAGANLSRRDFYGEAHGLVWDALLWLDANDGAVDTTRLISRLTDRGQLAPVGGVDFVLGLTEGIPLEDPPVARVRLCALRRREAEAAKRYSDAAARGEPLQDVRRALDEARAELDSAERPPADVKPAIEWRGAADIFAPLPPTKWVVPGLQLCPGRPAMLAGYGASAKTMSAQALGLAVASGTLAWGHFQTLIGEVRHLDYEQGWHATARRYQRLAVGGGIHPKGLGERLKLCVFPSVFLDSPNAVDAYAAAGDGAALVILDAFRGATPTQDENDSSIRRSIDNLTRASEKNGAVYLMLHHAGKPKEGHSDARTILRGSSGIFDARGCVLVVSAGKTKTKPRKVSQEKLPAEAEGAGLDNFTLRVDDVADGDNPTAGVRVVYRPEDIRDPIAVNREAISNDAERLLRVIGEKPGSSQTLVISEAGIKAARGAMVLGLLEDEGRVRFVEGPRKARLYYLGGRP